jgi:virginiamycin B lyase
MVEGLEDRALLSGTLTRFPVPESLGQPGSTFAGPDGNVWFLGSFSNPDNTFTTTVDRITPDGRVSVVAPVPGQIEIDDFTDGPDGNVWYAGIRTLDQKTNATEAVIGRVSPSGDVAEFIVPNAFDANHITSGQEGNLWFTADSLVNVQPFIGRITPGGQITEFNQPTLGSSADGIAADGQGNLWVAAEPIVGQRATIFRFTTSVQITDRIRLPAVQGAPFVNGMTTGPDGNVWFTEGRLVMRITPKGRLTRFTVLPPSVVHGAAGQITSAPGRELFFSVQSTADYDQTGPPPEIGEITTSGRVSFIRFPKGVFLVGRPVVEPGDNLWFNDSFNGIDRLTLPSSHRRGGG